MKPCKRIGIEVTKKCNLKCKTCFYRFKPDFNEQYDRPMSEITPLIDAGKAGGCDHVVVVGWGEPFLYKELPEFFKYCHDRELTTSIISNGCYSPDKLAKAFDQGMNHLHLSVHGLGETLDTVFGVPGAHKRQEEVKKWLKDNEKPWRSNTTLQIENYKQLPEIVENCIENGVYHFVFLGFLPHYEWEGRLKEVAVHPAELRPYIEKGIELLEQAGRWITVRYHPMCHLKEEYRKYVVNARYVVYDPHEWCYNIWPNEPDDAMWINALQVGGSVAICDAPCRDCALYLHCGGWNKVYAAGFDGAGLQAIPKEKVSRECLTTKGYLHDQNPVNHTWGYIK